MKYETCIFATKYKPIIKTIEEKFLKDVNFIIINNNKKNVGWCVMIKKIMIWGSWASNLQHLKFQ